MAPTYAVPGLYLFVRWCRLPKVVGSTDARTDEFGLWYREY